MKTFEYKIESFLAMTMDSLEEILNRCGREGWRVRFAWPSQHHLLFEREVEIGEILPSLSKQEKTQ